AIVLVLASACGGGAKGSAKTWLGAMKDAGTIRVGTTSVLPFSYVDPETKKLRGALIDVFREYLKRNHVKAKLVGVNVPFRNLIPAVKSGRVDIVVDAIYRQPDRMKQVQFPGNVLYDPETLIVPPGNPKDLHGLSD